MAFTFVTGGMVEVDADTTTVDVALTGINAGDVVAAWAKWEGTGVVSASVATSGGSDSFTAGTRTDHSNNALSGQFFYLLATTVTGSVTYRLTLSFSRLYKRLGVLVFRPDAGDTIALEAQNTGQGTSASPVSGAISPSGNDLVVVGGNGEYAGYTLTDTKINGVTRDGIVSGATGYTHEWYRILTSGFTNGAAELSGYSSAAWVCNIIAISATGASGVTTRQLTDNITLTDSDAQLMNLARQLSEAVAVSDGDAFYRTLQSQVSSLMEMVDSVAPQRFATRQLTELITILDSASNGLGQIVTRALTDNISLSDAIARILTRAREDFTDVNDSSEVTRQRIRGLADTILLIDNIVDQHAIRNRVTTTNLILVDSLLRVALLTRTLTDTAELSDSQTATYYAASSVALGYILHGFAQEGIVADFEREQLH